LALYRISGLGPSGAALAITLKGRVIASDIHPKYFKACGEAVPLETPLIDKRYVVSSIKRFLFYQGETSIGEVSYRRPRWYIVDKPSWIESLRERIKPFEGTEKGDPIYIDARGPYSSKGLKIYVARAYIRNHGRQLDPEAVYFIYPRGYAGFYWVFPYGRIINIGGGFIGIRNPVPYIIRFIGKWLGGGYIEDLRGAPLTVYPEIDLGRGRIYRVGEAAGLVYPLTGEGIRPGILSALALASSLGTRDPLRNYYRAVSRIIRQIETQKRVLRIAMRIMSRGGSISQLVDNSVLRDYIEENISGRTLLTMISRNPVKAMEIVSRILRK